MQLPKDQSMHIIGESRGETEISQNLAQHHRTLLLHHAQRNTSQFIAQTRPTW
jgi:hypothetical protein